MRAGRDAKRLGRQSKGMSPHDAPSAAGQLALIFVACATLLCGAGPAMRAVAMPPPDVGPVPAAANSVWDTRLSDSEITSVASSRILISPRSTPGSAPFTEATLWFTSDRAQTWQQWTGASEPNGSITFEAPSDGLYGLYSVLHNAAGASAPAPQPGTAPQKWVWVDRSAPIVQILGLLPDKHFETNREIRLRWLVRDENLSTRPVRLHYRCERTKSYRLIADLLPVDGSYRWTVPQNVSGRLEVKVSATDRAGNTGRCVVDRLRFSAETGQLVAADLSEQHPSASPNAGAAKLGARSNAPSADAISIEIHRGYREPPAAAEMIEEEAASRAKKLYDLGTWHRLRGEYAVAALRYADALELDPNRLAARNDLGGLLLLSGRHEEAEQAFRQVLEADPRHAAALESLALVQAARQNYRSARDTLGRLLLLDPLDADAWLHLGDVTMFMGNRQSAREAWRKVGTLEQASDEVKERARKRLAIYKGTSTVKPPVPAGEPVRAQR